MTRLDEIRKRSIFLVALKNCTIFLTPDFYVYKDIAIKNDSMNLLRSKTNELAATKANLEDLDPLNIKDRQHLRRGILNSISEMINLKRNELNPICLKYGVSINQLMINAGKANVAGPNVNISILDFHHQLHIFLTWNCQSKGS
jgi:hypothetical protein